MESRIVMLIHHMQQIVYGKGWYSGVSGNSDHKTGIDLTNKENSPKNIYDMAGNVKEWIMESRDSNLRVLRGGYFNDSGSEDSASERSSYAPSIAEYGGSGFRVALTVPLIETKF